MPADGYQTGLVKIPANIDVEDRIMGGFTARQCVILGSAGAVSWLWFMVTRTLLPLAVIAATVVPVMAVAFALALVRRDGLHLDRLALAALRQHASPRRLVPAPDGVPAPPSFVPAALAQTTRPLPGPLNLPVTGIGEHGVLDLGDQGWAVLVACQPVSFALATPAEQEGMVAGFARVLHSITAEVQILVRARRLDLTEHVRKLRTDSPSLPHPALEAAALAHAAYLQDLAATADLLWRQVLLVVRQPQTGDNDGAAVLAVRQAEQIAHQLAAASVTATVLDTPAVHAVLSSALDPGQNGAHP